MRLNKRRGHGAPSNTTSRAGALRLPSRPVLSLSSPSAVSAVHPGKPGPGQAPTTQDPRIGQVALCYRSEGALLLSSKSLNPGAVKWRRY
jgi:hypothetical protein